MSFSGKGRNGLANVGNTCYINCCVQCLGHCPDFLNYVLYGTYPHRPVSLMLEMRDIYERLWIHDCGVVPHRLLQTIQHVFKDVLSLNDQNDIQEFLILLIDKLNQSVATKSGAVAQTRLSTDTSCMTQSLNEENNQKMKRLACKMEQAWSAYFKDQLSGMTDILYGQMITQLVCGNPVCKKIHHNYETFCCLFVDVPSESCSLDICIANAFKNEVMNTENTDATQGCAWTCDKCKESRKSERSMRIWKLPKVLIICLKRFKYMRNSQRFEKITSLVKVPETLNVRSISLDVNTNNQFSLKAVANHIGSFSSGHYYAQCKNPNGIWYNIDDITVTQETTRYTSTRDAYVLFYHCTPA